MEPGDNRAMIHDELQRLLENNAIALLSARNPNNEEGPHQPRRSFGSLARGEVAHFPARRTRSDVWQRRDRKEYKHCYIIKRFLFWFVCAFVALFRD